VRRCCRGIEIQRILRNAKRKEKTAIERERERERERSNGVKAGKKEEDWRIDGMEKMDRKNGRR